MTPNATITENDNSGKSCETGAFPDTATSDTDFTDEPVV